MERVVFCQQINEIAICQHVCQKKHFVPLRVKMNKIYCKKSLTSLFMMRGLRIVKSGPRTLSGTRWLKLEQTAALQGAFNSFEKQMRKLLSFPDVLNQAYNQRFIINIHFFNDNHIIQRILNQYRYSSIKTICEKVYKKSSNVNEKI